ncbi:peptidoglycan DD-metalloendopeptidase family protein [Rouxiella sp. Mn2063]|uniref:peptidoglycan DD-metalloendopeptidase family protein n=1 Tax=Rouxiella sp. Mn2063 TaxID=3395262 RepID=UPI003BCEF5A6
MDGKNHILIFSFLTICLTGCPAPQPHSTQDKTLAPNQAYRHFEQWLVPTAGTISSSFNDGENHNKGINISGIKGQPIVAVADGQVLYVGNALKGYENLIIIKHNNIFRSAYSNNQQALVKEQEFVKAGQVIATMGSSNNAAPQLHFEIRKNGVPVDPMAYLPSQSTR